MPGLRERLDDLGWLIKAIGGLIALLPGVAMLLGLVEIPPDIHDLILYISFAISAVTIIAVVLLTPQIHRLKRGWAVGIIVICAIGGAISAVVYLDYSKRHILAVTTDRGAETLVLPHAPSPELDRLVKPLAHDYEEALNTHPQRARIRTLLTAESGGATWRIVLLLVLAQTLTIAAIVFGAWKLTGSLKPSRPEPST